jgi:hypothetical protein
MEEKRLQTFYIGETNAGKEEALRGGLRRIHEAERGTGVT